jgi:hypothetical protein
MHGERQQLMVPRPLLISILGAHSVDQSIAVDHCAIAKKEIPTDRLACRWKFGCDVLVHESIPNVPQQPERNYVMP